MGSALDFFIGEWQGSGGGEPGIGQYERSYELILNDKFIYVQNKSIYPPSEQNPLGEVHEDWGFISQDKIRHTFIYRQFHSEGFVNQYVLDYLAEDGTQFVFISENIENIPPGWRAKETYKVISADEFSETFELAQPGRDFEIYSQCQLRRKK